MKIEEIKNLVSTFPSNSPYFQAIRAQYYPGTRKPTASQLSLFAMKDPALGWHLARLYFLAGQDLPKEIWWDAVRRAYACLKHPAQTKYTDQACHEALALGGPENPAFQAQLKAFLCSGLSYREIAARLGFSEEVVRLFAHLFFDFPERRENQLFVHSVLDPQ